MQRFDLAIVGAGPAGMAAAREAAEAGLRVALVDEQPRAGGQIYRDVARGGETFGDVLGADYLAGLPLVEGITHDNITVFAGHTVWAIEKGLLALSSLEGGLQISARYILLATGAMERPMPVPGWTLPGVMGAGAAQVMLKQSGLAVQNAVLVGSGPLLHSFAAQLVRAGAPPVAIVETRRRADTRWALTQWRLALRARRYVQRNLADLTDLRNAGVRRYMASEDVALLGERRVEAVFFRSGGRRHELACNTALLHHGVVPHVQLTRAVGVPHLWSDTMQAHVPVCDSWGRTEVPRIWLAGDGTLIGGARAAELSGRIAALGIAHDLGFVRSIERDRRTGAWREERDLELSLRPLIDRAFPPYQPALVPKDQTTVCRCEEINAGSVREAARNGAAGVNHVKVLTRAGMGRCQGRLCGTTIARLVAQENGYPIEYVGVLSARPPVKPVTLGVLADLVEPNRTGVADD